MSAGFIDRTYCCTVRISLELVCFPADFNLRLCRRGSMRYNFYFGADQPAKPTEVQRGSMRYLAHADFPRIFSCWGSLAPWRGSMRYCFYFFFRLAKKPIGTFQLAFSNKWNYLIFRFGGYSWKPKCITFVSLLKLIHNCFKALLKVELCSVWQEPLFWSKSS